MPRSAPGQPVVLCDLVDVVRQVRGRHPSVRIDINGKPKRMSRQRAIGTAHVAEVEDLHIAKIDARIVQIVQEPAKIRGISRIDRDGIALPRRREVS